MRKGKTVIERIESRTSRQVTFSKRRNGLMKKALELSVLCEAEVGVIVFSPTNKLWEFSSTSMEETIERYQRAMKYFPIYNETNEQNLQSLKLEKYNLKKEIETTDMNKRRLLGQGLNCCSIEELQELENQLEQSLLRVRERKNELLMQQIKELRKNERVLEEERQILLTGKFAVQQSTEKQRAFASYKGIRNSEVNTDLLIGRPEVRDRNDQPLQG